MAPGAESFAPFKPRVPWLTGDLQTIRNFIRRPRFDFSPFAEERLVIAMEDASGDALHGVLNRPRLQADRALIVLVHGLTGCSDSVYMRASAHHLLTLGHAVLRLDLRGAGAGRHRTRHMYHSGRGEDLRAALRVVRARLRPSAMAAIGYSLGANMLVKFMAEEGTSAPLAAAIAVSTPIDLAASARRLMAPRNAFYQAYLLRRMREDALSPMAALTQAQREGARDARDVVAFDDRVTAPRNGFADAADYYERNAARRFLGAVRAPMLVIHAGDDPWIPPAAYATFDWKSNSALTLLMPSRGGHVGFHAAGSPVAWHDRCAGEFLGRLDSTGQRVRA